MRKPVHYINYLKVFFLSLGTVTNIMRYRHKHYKQVRPSAALASRRALRPGLSAVYRQLFQYTYHCINVHIELHLDYL